LFLEKSEIEIAPAMPGELLEAALVGLLRVVKVALAMLGQPDPKPRLVQIGVDVEGLAIHSNGILRVAAVEEHGAKVDQIGCRELAALGLLPIHANRLVTRIIHDQPTHEHRLVRVHSKYRTQGKDSDRTAERRNPGAVRNPFHPTFIPSACAQRP
jgi:hypothetical protein